MLKLSFALKYHFDTVQSVHHPNKWPGRATQHTGGHTRCCRGNLFEITLCSFYTSINACSAAEAVVKAMRASLPYFRERFICIFMKRLPQMHAVLFLLSSAVFVFLSWRRYSGGGAVLLSEMKALYCTPFLFPGTWVLFGRRHNNGLFSLSFPAVKKDDSAFDEVGQLSSSTVGRDPRDQLCA